MRRGPLLMILATGLFTLMVGIAREGRQSFTAAEMMWWRSGVAMPIAWALAARVGWRVRRPRLLLIRTSLGFAAMFCFFSAVKELSLANATLLGKFQPMLIALAAPLWLGRDERAGRGGWVAVALGFSGCALLLIPSLGRGSWYGLWAVLGTVFSAAAHLSLRRLAKDSGPGSPRPDHPLTLVFWFQSGVFFYCCLWLLFERGTMLPSAPRSFLPWLLVCGMAGAGGQLLMTWAYRLDRAPRVAAASYVSPLWAVLGDLLVFRLVPSAMTLVGGGLLVSAGLLLLRRGDE